MNLLADVEKLETSQDLYELRQKLSTCIDLVDSLDDDIMELTIKLNNLLPVVDSLTDLFKPNIVRTYDHDLS